MTYTAKIKKILIEWYERERKHWTGWGFNLLWRVNAKFSYMDGLAELQHVNDAGEDISDEYDTVTVQNTGQVSVTSSYDDRMPLLDAAQLRGLAELSESIAQEVARQKGGEA